MTHSPRKSSVFASLAVLTLVLAGCATPPPEPSAPEEVSACKAAASGEALVGTWMSVRRESGVTGELRSLFTLRADGTMSYAEQLSRPKRAPQGLAEAGCWVREGSTLVLRTTESNGSPVDLDDPIYVNRYQVVKEGSDRLRLRSPEGVQLDAKRMPADYRLPL